MVRCLIDNSGCDVGTGLRLTLQPKSKFLALFLFILVFHLYKGLAGAGLSDLRLNKVVMVSRRPTPDYREVIHEVYRL